jgi:integrase
MTLTPRSLLAPTIRSYLTLKRALGRQYASEERVLAHLDRFLVGGRADLTAETFAAWSLTLQHRASGCRRACMRTVRNLCLYRQRREPDCFIPDVRLFPPEHHAIRPHFFTEGDVPRLLTAARRRTRTENSPLCPENLRLAVVLLYTTGLRRRELTRLTVGDYDPRAQTLMIRASKFHKSRLLPLSAGTAGEIVDVVETRRRERLPVDAESALLWNRSPSPRGYSGGGLGHTLRKLFQQAEIRTATGNLPRAHDFRHSFALAALLRWYHAGMDVQAKLPLLATYMGHVSIESTAYYLQFVEPLGTAAGTRFADACGALITPPITAGAR